MPFLKDFIINDSTKIMIWDIVLNELAESELKEYDKLILKERKLVKSKEQFLAVRKLLKFENPKLTINYNSYGRPYLNDNLEISISHSKNLVALGISKKNKLGIDIQYISEKVENVKDKFLNKSERKYFGKNLSLKTLTLIWTSKESIYKILNLKGVSFSKDICIEFITKNKIKGRGLFKRENKTVRFDLYFFYFSNYILCYAEEIKLN